MSPNEGSSKYDSKRKMYRRVKVADKITSYVITISYY